MRLTKGDYGLSLDYTPSLKRAESCVVTKVRRLRPPCRIKVSAGQKVNVGSILAILEGPGVGHMILLENTELAIPLDILLTNFGFDYINCVTKKIGEHVSKDEIVARRNPLGKLERIYKSPYEGVISTIREPGVLGIREIKEVNVTAFVPGTVSHIIPDREIALETAAALIQGIYGIGGETSGELEVLVESPSEVAKIDELAQNHAGKILVCGSSLQQGFLSKAKEIGVKGIVVASLDNDELTSFLNFSPSMITGHEHAGLTLVMTQGFGSIPMLEATYGILKKFEGKTAFLNGSTQMRAGVIRPEIIIPRDDLSLAQCRSMRGIDSEGLTKGMRVRVLGGEYFGQIGVVNDLSPKSGKLETESEVQVLEVVLQKLGPIIIPKANVEPIEC